MTGAGAQNERSKLTEMKDGLFEAIDTWAYDLRVVVDKSALVKLLEVARPQVRREPLSDWAILNTPIDRHGGFRLPSQDEQQQPAKITKYVADSPGHIIKVDPEDQ